VIKQTITYTDYHDQEQTEDFYFNLTKLEVLEMEIDFEGGLTAYIEKLTQTTAGAEAYHLFKDILLKSYGVKAADGKTFQKSEEIRRQFEESPAMAELIFSFLQNGVDAAAFVRGLLPTKMIEEAEAEAAKNPQGAAAQVVAGTVEPNSMVAVSPEPVAPTEEISDEELLKMDPQKMTHSQLQRAFMLKAQQ